jgi:hypothetical protein
MTHSATAYVIEQSWIPVVPRGLDFYNGAGSTSGEFADDTAPAAKEILADPAWSDKIARALMESYDGNIQSLDDFRANL